MVRGVDGKVRAKFVVFVESGKTKTLVDVGKVKTLCCVKNSRSENLH
jgi:hypothetical protein